MICRSPRSAIRAGDFGDGSAGPIDCCHDEGVSETRVVEHGCQAGAISFGRSGQFVGEDMLRVDAGVDERGQLSVESWPAVLTLA